MMLFFVSLPLLCFTCLLLNSLTCIHKTGCKMSASNVYWEFMNINSIVQEKYKFVIVHKAWIKFDWFRFCWFASQSSSSMEWSLQPYQVSPFRRRHPHLSTLSRSPAAWRKSPASPKPWRIFTITKFSMTFGGWIVPSYPQCHDEPRSIHINRI